MSLPVIVVPAHNDFLSLSVARALVVAKSEVYIPEGFVSPNFYPLFPKEVVFMPFHKMLSMEVEYYVFLDSGTKLGFEPGERRGAQLTATEKKGFFEAIKSFTKPSHGKFLFVFPLLSSTGHEDTFKYIESLPVATKTLFVGDTYGPNMSLGGKREIDTILAHAIENKPVPVSTVSSDMYIIDGESLANEVARAVFSYWYSDKNEIKSVTIKITYSDIVNEFFNNGIEVKLVHEKSLQKPTPIIPVVTRKDYKLNLAPTLLWLGTKKEVRREVVAPKAKKVPKVNHKKRKLKLNTVFLAFIVTVWLFLAPVIALASAGLALKIASGEIIKGDARLVKPLATYSQSVGDLSERFFGTLTPLPVVGSVFKDLTEASSVIKDSSEVLVEGQALLVNVQKLKTGILGKGEYEIEPLAGELSLGLDSIYKKTGVIEGKVRSSPFLSGFLPKGVDLGKAREYLWAASELASRLPNLISGPTTKTYLVLLQNNMELRPTGGFIGSFALVTFDKGKLIDTNVLDVYSADGQLKGHVEPPTAIKNYLGEANWYLRDSNWDPDFGVSAKNAEWFLSKEIDREVDGVIAVDLFVAKGLVEHYGSIHLADFNIELTPENLYEKLQHEVENDFFPGSTKKASILTSLAQNLLSKLQEDNVSLADDISLIEMLVENFEQKHILANFHDKSANDIVDQLGWGGRLPDNRYIEIVDANVGVNKSNYYLNRAIALNIELGDQETKYTATVKLKNLASNPLDIGNQYKSYLRLVTNEGEFGNVIIKDSQKEESMSPEVTKSEGRVEAGVVVTIAPGGEREVVFMWSTKPSLNINQGNYELTLVKQPGTDQDPASVSMTFPKGLTIIANPAFDLTRGSTFGYNLNLTEDFYTSISWSK